MTFEIEKIIPLLEKEVEGYKVPIVDLIAVQTKDPYKVLVATILSARTKDEVTSKAATRLFKEAPDLAHLAELSEERISKLIYPVGFYKNKAGYLKKLPDELNKKFNNIIPDEVEQLVKLPGVGRKTANVILNTAFGEPTIAVDTHIFRVANRTRLARGKTPLAVEKRLLKFVPEEFLHDAHHWLILHGRYVCKARKPDCPSCVIAELCEYRGKTKAA